MRYYLLLTLIIIITCSKTPSDVPIGSSRDVEFNVDMNNPINDGLFLVNDDTLSLVLDPSEIFEMNDEDNDNIYSLIISNLILGRTYEYQYAINDNLENLEEKRFFTVQNTENTVLDHYEEINPTIIIFLVNMSYQIEIENYNTDSDFLDVAGTFNNWDGIDHHLIETENNIYEISITNVDPGDIIEYKFRINGQWDNSEFSGGGENRSYVVEQGENILELWYNDEDGD